MQVRTRHTPAFGVARLLLAPGEGVQADAAAMVATSYGVLVETRARAAKGPRPAMFTAPAEGGWVDLAPPLPGDVYTLELDGMSGWCVARDCWLAAAGTVRTDPQWSGLQGLFGAEHGFIEHVAGAGALVLACAGALDVVSLGPGELVTVVPGHLLAYSDQTQVRLRATSQNGHQSVRTGEGLMLDFAGPGELLTQTRTARSMAAWLSAARSGGR